jgi:hypothetical protein
MSNQRYNYYDPDFDAAKGSNDLELLILIADDTFSFAVVHGSPKTVLVWGEQYNIAELRSPAELSNILTEKFAGVKIGIQAQSFTIVHKDLYQADKVTEYARYLDVKQGEVILVNELDADNYVIFKVNDAIIDTINVHFDARDLYFAAKPWIAAINKANPYLQPLYINVNANTVQLYHTCDGKLDFYNSFKFNNADELMYYTVLTANELNINLDATSVILSGDITVSDKRIQRVSDLLPKVDFNHNQVVSLPPGFISHQILMLAGLTLCESLVEN